MESNSQRQSEGQASGGKTPSRHQTSADNQPVGSIKSSSHRRGGPASNTSRSNQNQLNATAQSQDQAHDQRPQMSATHHSQHSGSRQSVHSHLNKPASNSGRGTASNGAGAPFTSSGQNKDTTPTGGVINAVEAAMASTGSRMPRLESSNFFKMSGMPRFGKQWLDNFIQDQELQNTFLTSEVVRNLVMLECVFYASVYNDLILYKQAFLLQKSQQNENGLNEESAALNTGSHDHEESKHNDNQLSSADGGKPNSSQDHQSMASPSGINKSNSRIVQNSVELLNEMPPFKIGIIGCGHLGTMILTKLLEISGSFNNLKLLVSTRQPHLLRPFVQEFGIIAEFNNERIVRECDIIFLTVLPSQASEMLKEIRPIAQHRLYQASKDKNLSKPLFVSAMSATRMPKLRLMLSEDSIFMRTQIDVNIVREYLARTDNSVPEKPLHPAQILAQKGGASQQLALNAEGQAVAVDGDQDQAATKNEVQAPSSVQSSQQDGNSESQQRKENLKKVLSHKAIQIGAESGVTAEFIVKQTSEQLVSKLDDMFLMFDTFQEALYSNDPAIYQRAQSAGGASEHSSQKSQSAVDRALSNVAGAQASNAAAGAPKSDAGNNKVMYEESILMTLLGPEYMQFISEETGEWVNEAQVIEKFQELFETRIRCIFDAQ